VNADRRLYLDRSQARLVEESDPACAWLLVGKGQEIPAEKVKRLGLVVHEGRVMQASQVPAPKAPEPEMEEVKEYLGITAEPEPEPESRPIWPSAARRSRKK
jgi:hypothetical protein